MRPQAREGNKKSGDTRLNTSLLKLYVPQAAMEVADSAMQIMGSISYISTSRVGRIWQECRGNRFADGTDQIMSTIAGKRIAVRAEREKDFPPVWRF